jgi:predicted ATPase
LQTARLITLVGAPGIGKTRLALEVAHAVLGQFADGVVFVSLAEVQTAEDIPYAVLRQLDIAPAPQQTAVAAIQAYLAPRSLLLVLDNCEHLLESATLFTDWLAQAPRLKLLCTSRTPLDLYGEQEWPLTPLPVPDLAQRPSPAWADTAAMQLLLARAQAIDPTFALNDDNLLPLATLCAALDGLPLALELAAARLRDHEPANLVQQLLMLRGNNQLASTWLQQTRRNVAERHRTLHAAIAWSVHLLPTVAQNAFYRLGVFVGGGVAAAAEAIAQADAALLAQLARANLVGVRNGRIHLLETLRAFALEQLTAADQLAATQQAHAHYYAQFTQEVFAGLLGDEQGVWMPRALADQDNFLAALRWALAVGDGKTAVAIAGNLWWFWYRRSLFAHGAGTAHGRVTASFHRPVAARPRA